MVASDTVVGLVGAGILLVALVGVFVYESQQGTGQEDLKNAQYSTQVQSSVNHQPASGQTVPNTGQCVPGTQCTPARTTADITLTGLPNPGNLRYVVFLEGGGNSVAVGEATASGNSYRTGQKTINGDHASKNTIVVSLESSGGATTPSWKIVSISTSGGTAEAKFIQGGGNHTVRFTTTGTTTTVRAELEQLDNRSGYTYRGWMVKDDDAGIAYEFVGNFTPSTLTGNRQDGVITGTVSGTKDDFARFIVTMEQTSATIGERPAGPPVITADYNMRPLVTAEK